MFLFLELFFFVLYLVCRVSSFLCSLIFRWCYYTCEHRHIDTCTCRNACAWFSVFLCNLLVKNVKHAHMWKRKCKELIDIISFSQWKQIWEKYALWLVLFRGQNSRSWSNSQGRALTLQNTLGTCIDYAERKQLVHREKVEFGTIESLM